MFKRFRLVLCVVPLLLGAVLGVVKWKQMHPTPTARDLGERAFLKQAEAVTVFCYGHEVAVPRREFDAALDEFYLIDLQNRKWIFMGARNANSLKFRGGCVIRAATAVPRDQTVPFAEIDFGSPASYTAKHAPPGELVQTQALMLAQLHPTTERRLRALVARHLPAR